MRRLALRSIFRVVCLATLIAAGANAQSPQPLTAIPKTPAGDVLREWFDVFNSGDSTRMAEFLRAPPSEFPLESHMALTTSQSTLAKWALA
jgi:hypothetical protein